MIKFLLLQILLSLKKRPIRKWIVACTVNLELTLLTFAAIRNKRNLQDSAFNKIGFKQNKLYNIYKYYYSYHVHVLQAMPT